MATDVHNAADATTSELVSGIISDAQDLMKQQFDLLRHEVLEDLRKTRDAAILFGVAAGLALIGAFMAMMTLVYLIPWYFPNVPLWGSFAIWTVVLALAAVALYYGGVAKLPTRILPEKSEQSLKESVQWITNPK
jgi:uncharacterized membrane protein YqjE